MANSVVAALFDFPIARITAGHAMVTLDCVAPLDAFAVQTIRRIVRQEWPGHQMVFVSTDGERLA